MQKVSIMLAEAEALALREFLESASDRGICNKAQRRTVDYVLDEINLLYPKKIHKDFNEYSSCCEPLSAIEGSDNEACGEVNFLS